ncbi:MAG: AAA family ATPase [Candidatus Rokubacteria bacterium]|nr:AAA family ATPase [Candidatus Rokubacteria bacterium]
MIKRLRFINYRSHADSEVYLEPLTVLIGPVAGGKSNVFKGMLLIQNSVHRSPEELFPPGLGEFHWVRSRWAGETDPVGFEVDLEKLPNDHHARYTLKLADSPAGIYVLEETLQRQIAGEPWEWVFQRRSRPHSMGEFGDVDPYGPTTLNQVWHRDPRVRQTAAGPLFARDVAEVLSRFGYFHLEASELKSLGTGQSWERIGYNGDRLPDFIAWAKGEPGAKVYESILMQMRELLPELEDILVTQVQPDRQGLAMSFSGYRGYIAAPDLSDGTMFTLGMLCIAASPRRPAVLCIEEPETGLHPRRLRWLFDRFMELAYPPEGQPRTQMILSTHSPYLVDFFKDMLDAVKVVEQKEGRSRIMSLTEIQKEKLRYEPETGESIGHLWASGLYEGF